MARTKDEKKELVKEYAERINDSKAVYIVQPNGISANQSVDIKKRLYDLDSSFNFIKVSLFKKALEENQLPIPAHLSNEAKAVIFTKDQPSEVAKTISEFAKENKDIITILSGYLDGKEISGAQIKHLAELPSKDVMLATVLATMNAPVSGFVNVLAGNIRNIVNVINAIKDKKEN